MKHVLPIATVLLLCPALARADGGTLRLHERAGDFQVSVFTAPELPRVGTIDISVLVQDASTGHVRLDVPVQIELHQLDSANLLLDKPADAASANNKLYQAAQFEIPNPGRWSAEIIIGRQTQSTSTADSGSSAAPESPLAFQFDVAPPSPPWLELAPWVAWPFAIIALFLLHQRLMGNRVAPPEQSQRRGLVQV